MIIAIHHKKGSFSDRWISYCIKNHVNYKVVNCYDTNIIEDIRECDGFMWHWGHHDYRDKLIAFQLIVSLEKMGIRVFPDSNTCWHYDDKIGQKYLLEAIDAPLVRSYVFYEKKSAIEWIDSTIYPKIHKLRGGAGSINVKLVNSKQQARRMINRAFGKGYPLADNISGIKDRLWRLKRDKNYKAIIHIVKGLVRVVYPQPDIKLMPRQKGYAYFQDFVADNAFDDRIVIIGKRAIGIRRFNRTGDFRASGSGLIDHNPDLINKESIKIAFDVAEKIGSQALAFDFIYDHDTPKIIEISYAFAQGPAYDNCPGYWDRNLIWFADNVDPQRYIIEDFLKSTTF